jgi:hypothetical protein
MEAAAEAYLQEYDGPHFESDTDTIYDCETSKGRACSCGRDERKERLVGLMRQAAEAE